jgi:hypothetical protein
MRAQEASAPVRTAYVLLALFATWILTRFSVEWGSSVTYQTRRFREAALLVDTFCTNDTEHLAGEFGKCEAAYVVLAGGSGGRWFKAVEMTIRKVALQTATHAIDIPISTLANALLVVCILGIFGVLYVVVTNHVRSAHELDIFSPMARARRLDASVYSGNVGFIDMKKFE